MRIKEGFNSPVTAERIYKDNPLMQSFGLHGNLPDHFEKSDQEEFKSAMTN